jgi:hypothetical protein
VLTRRRQKSNKHSNFKLQSFIEAIEPHPSDRASSNVCSASSYRALSRAPAVKPLRSIALLPAIEEHQAIELYLSSCALYIERFNELATQIFLLCNLLGLVLKPYTTYTTKALKKESSFGGYNALQITPIAPTMEKLISSRSWLARWQTYFWSCA